MTSRTPVRLRPEPARRGLAAVRPLVATCAVLGVLAAGGCGSDEPEQVAQVTQPVRAMQAPPPAPRVTSVADLMAELGIDERIRMEESNAPAGTEARIAVLEFFDSFVRGQSDQVRPMLAERDRPFLDLMVEFGTWEPTVEAIEDVELLAGRSPDSRESLLAMYVRDGVDEYQLWYYSEFEGAYEFEAAPTPPGVVALLSGPPEGYIEEWHAILDREMALASQPDIDVLVKGYVGEDEAEKDDERGPSAGSSPSPGGYPKRHRPAKRRRPPGVPGPG